MKMKKILLIVGLVLIVGGAAAGGMFLGRSQSAGAGGEEPLSTEDEINSDTQGGHGSTKAGGHGGDAASGDEKLSRPDLTYVMEKFTTNLSDDFGTFVQMKVELEAASPEGMDLIEQNLAPLRDATIMLLSSKTRDDVQTLAGKERLKRELLVRYQGVLNNSKQLRNIYITEFTVVRY
jgi:flagellar FliL protein